MNYIIEPRWFYWVNVVNNIKSLIGLINALLIVVLIVLLLFGLFSWADDWADEYFEDKRTAIKWLVILIVIFTTVTILLPTKETLIQMKVAEFATYDNVNIGFEKLIELIDYIVEKLR